MTRIEELSRRGKLGRTGLHVLSGCLAVALGPWFFDVFRVLWQGLGSIRHPFPTCITELWILDGVRALAEGRTLFPPARELPFSLHVYNTSSVRLKVEQDQLVSGDGRIRPGSVGLQGA